VGGEDWRTAKRDLGNDTYISDSSVTLIANQKVVGNSSTGWLALSLIMRDIKLSRIIAVKRRDAESSIKVHPPVHQPDSRSA
jgi:hypothetical protein